MKLTWYPPNNGDAIEFSSDSTSHLLTINFSGFTEVPVTHQTLTLPNIPPIWLGAVPTARQLSFEVRLMADTLQGVLDLQAELAGAFYSPAGQGVLVWEQEDGSKYAIVAIGDQGPVSESGLDARGWNYQKCTIHLLAHDPHWYSSAANVAYLSGLPNPWIPWAIPWVVGGFGTELTAVNEGTAFTPVIVRIFGPITNPMLANTTTGASVALEMTINNGAYVEMNSDNGVMSAIHYKTDGTTEKAFKYFSACTLLSLFGLDPGNNDLALTCSAATEGTLNYHASIEWRDKWAGR